MCDSARRVSGSPHPDSRDRLLTAKQLATVLAISIRTVWRLDAAGRLPRPIRLGGSVRWRGSEIDRWLRAGCPDRATWERNHAGGSKAYSRNEPQR